MHFCLVTTHHLCNNPRLVKEADALAAAGHGVRVIWLDARADLRARDEALTSSRHWRLQPIAAGRRGLRGWTGWIKDGVRRKLARTLSDLGLGGRWLAEESLTRWPRAIDRAVRAAHADVVVAHTLGALPPASRAARTLGARLVFDAEDLHAGELPDAPAHSREQSRIALVERRYLPRCHRILASSDGIADALNEAYAVARPRVVLNTFPLPAARSSIDRVGRAPVKLYWFSQVIGTDRGLQSALDALAILGDDFELYLRGEDRPGITSDIRAHAAATGVASRVHLLAVGPPDELPSLATEYDIGLALETGHSRNNALAVSNKLLTYLAAGLAIAATDTPGQRGVMRRAAGAGFLFEPGDAASLANGLRELTAEPGRLAEAKRASRRAAEDRFSWEIERHRLLDALTDWLPRGVASCGAAQRAP